MNEKLDRAFNKQKEKLIKIRIKLRQITKICSRKLRRKMGRMGLEKKNGEEKWWADRI